MCELYTFTKQEIADVFNKWQQEVKDTPEAFTDCEVYEGDYGLACATTLIRLMKGE